MSYIGALAPVFSVTAVRMTSFSIYQKAKYKYSAAIGKATGSDEPLIVVNRPGSIPTPATMLCFGAAGATAGSIITLLSCKLGFASALSSNSKRSCVSRSFRTYQTLCTDFDIDGKEQHF